MAFVLIPILFYFIKKSKFSAHDAYDSIIALRNSSTVSLPLANFSENYPVHNTFFGSRIQINSLSKYNPNFDKNENELLENYRSLPNVPTPCFFL